MRGRSTSFIDGMLERDVPLHVFHFDCFWMKEFQWCDFQWDKRRVPRSGRHAEAAEGQGAADLRLDQPLHRPASQLFREGKENGYLSSGQTAASGNGTRGRPAWRLVDFTNPAARALVQGQADARCWRWAWTASRPTSASAFRRMSSITTAPIRMQNAQLLYVPVQQNRVRGAGGSRGEGRGGAVRPVGHGRRRRSSRCTGAATARPTYDSMAETLRGGLSLGLSRLRLLEPRHQRLRTHRAAGSVQALGRRSGCCPRTAGCTATSRTACRGCSTTRRWTCCATSRS